MPDMRGSVLHASSRKYGGNNRVGRRDPKSILSPQQIMALNLPNGAYKPKKVTIKHKQIPKLIKFLKRKKARTG